jgi:hypothetical protein
VCRLVRRVINERAASEAEATCATTELNRGLGVPGVAVNGSPNPPPIVGSNGRGGVGVYHEMGPIPPPMKPTPIRRSPERGLTARGYAGSMNASLRN